MYILIYIYVYHIHIYAISKYRIYMCIYVCIYLHLYITFAHQYIHIYMYVHIQNIHVYLQNIHIWSTLYNIADKVGCRKPPRRGHGDSDCHAITNVWMHCGSRGAFDHIALFLSSHMGDSTEGRWLLTGLRSHTWTWTQASWLQMPQSFYQLGCVLVAHTCHFTKRNLVPGRGLL